jgi:putative transposase
VSRQAYYKSLDVLENIKLREEFILAAVREIRRGLPRLGVRKIHYLLPQFGISAGRDQLFDLLKRFGMLIDRRRDFRRTTNSYHRFHKYPNLIRNSDVRHPNQVFVSDITYLKTQEGFCYLALVTDLYSRKIVGWDLSRSLSIEGCQKALLQALNGISATSELIHHSDRGLQYCSQGYVQILIQKNVRISMTEESHCYENAVAERINGILKEEFYLDRIHASFKNAKALSGQAIHSYNNKRPHLSLSFKTPAQCYMDQDVPPRRGRGCPSPAPPSQK